MLKVMVNGDWKKTEKLLQLASNTRFDDILHKYGEMGLQALKDNTPVDTGRTAASWSYEVKRGRESDKIIWSNSNVNHGVPIAILLQYGHATGTGGWVEGRDYINPALQKIFDQMADDLWEEVTN